MSLFCDILETVGEKVIRITLFDKTEIAYERGDGMDYRRISGFISYVLRHNPGEIGLTLDEYGWADAEALVAALNSKRPFTMEMLEELVAIDSKQRYSFNEDKTLIRANQGHSVSVDVGPEQQIPPEYLWHGTATRYVASIEEQGLLPQSRLYVHLSSDYETAVNVGSRHGKPLVFKVKSAEMHNDGFVFWRSVNGVWLTKHVPVEYLQKQKRDDINE